jgi:hypothetical protein
MKIISNDPVMPDPIYKDHRIATSRVGKGWRAKIYPAEPWLPYRKVRPSLKNLMRGFRWSNHA